MQSNAEMKIIAGLLMSPILVTHSSAYNPKNDPNLYKGHPIDTTRLRQKRSLFDVFKLIFKDSKLITKSPHLRLYYKSGGLKKALEDYNSLQPTVVRNGGILDKVGRVGNSRVVLTEAEGYPALMIPGKSLDNKYRTDRLIVYTEQTTPFGQRYN